MRSLNLHLLAGRVLHKYISLCIYSERTRQSTRTSPRDSVNDLPVPVLPEDQVPRVLEGLKLLSPGCPKGAWGLKGLSPANPQGTWGQSPGYLGA